MIVESRELIVVRDIAFSSRCEAHGLPYFGVVHVGYVQEGDFLDGAELADAIEQCSRPSQRQERLTGAVSDWLELRLEPMGSAVVLDAEHACHAGRQTKVLTARFRGAVQHDESLRAEFLSQLRR